MEKLVGMVIGSLFCAMSANAVELGGDIRSGVNNAGVDLVLELSGINYSYPETVLRNDKVAVGSRVTRDAGAVFDYDTDSTFGGWSDYAGGYRLTAGILENNLKEKSATGGQNGIELDAESAKSDITLGNQSREASSEKSIPYGSGKPGAVRDGKLKVAVGVGVTSVEVETDLDAESSANGFNGIDHAELVTLLNEAETETSIDLVNYFDRPVLAIGVNYAF